MVGQDVIVKLCSRVGLAYLAGIITDMKCPLDQTVLQITNRQGVEIDYCPQCRGIWLDRNELERLIELDQRSGADTRGRDQRYDEYRRHDDDDDRPRYEEDRHQQHHRKKESFLGDLFDF